MSQTMIKNKKRKAGQIDSNQSKDEQTAKAKRIDSGERKY